MTIRSRLEAAQRLNAPPPTAKQLEATGHRLIAIGETLVAIAKGDEGAMEGVYDAAEFLASQLEDLPGPDRVARAIASRVLKGAAQKVRDEIHG